MPRKRKLDRYVSVFVDRHGKERFRFRRDGVSLYLPPPGSQAYRDRYNEALNGVRIVRARPGTFNELVSKFYQSTEFRKAGPSWQATMRQYIETVRSELGDDAVVNFRPKDINRLIADRMVKRQVGKRVHGGTASAERLREVLLRLFEFAVVEEMRGDNPVIKSTKVDHRGDGFYAWTERDIAQFRARWPLGTKPRLAMELMLWTGSRRGNAHTMPPPVDGRFRTIAVKTGKEIDLHVAPALQAAIAAMDKVGTATLIETSFGKPYTAAGFGNWFKAQCLTAGLPKCTAHGLRKALTRRAADLNVSQQSLKALGQWTGDREVAVYADTANRKRLAGGALDQVAEWEQSGCIV